MVWMIAFITLTCIKLCTHLIVMAVHMRLLEELYGVKYNYFIDKCCSHNNS